MNWMTRPFSSMQKWAETWKLSVLLPPGRYCVLINDIGNLTVMNDFAIVLVQP